MKERLIYYLDKIIYMLEDTLPNPGEDDKARKNMLLEIRELQKIRRWVKGKI